MASMSCRLRKLKKLRKLRKLRKLSKLSKLRKLRRLRKLIEANETKKKPQRLSSGGLGSEISLPNRTAPIIRDATFETEPGPLNN